MPATRGASLFLTTAFLAVIFSAATVQTAIELRRGERVQVLDLLERPPTQRNLRRFERDLEEASVAAGALRPVTQAGLYLLLGDAGEKGLAGRDGWLFYRPGWEYLTQRGPAGESPAPGGDPLPAILSLRDQLQARGIHLLVVPVPNKESIHPDKLSRRAAEMQVVICRDTSRFFDRLEAAGIDAVNLFEAFRRAKAASAGQGPPLYMPRDTHWSPEGLELAAEAVAEHLLRQGIIRRGDARYHRAPITVERCGDILEMMQCPPLEAILEPERHRCLQVRCGLGGAPYQDESEAEILLMGDSFLRVFEHDEPGGAGFAAQLAYRLEQPLTSLVSDGGGSTLVRQQLARRPELLEGKRLVIWEFVERDLRYGVEGWQVVDLWPRGPGDSEGDARSSGQRAIGQTLRQD